MVPRSLLNENFDNDVRMPIAPSATGIHEHLFARIATPEGARPKGRKGPAMAKNTGNNYRRGEVRRRSQLPNPLTGGYTKRDKETGRFMDGKEGMPFKGVRKEKGQ